MSRNYLVILRRIIFQEGSDKTRSIAGGTADFERALPAEKTGKMSVLLRGRF